MTVPARAPRTQQQRRDETRRALLDAAVESLVEHRSSMEGEGSPTPKDLLRLSVGLEDAGDLYDDLAAALDAAHRN